MALQYVVVHFDDESRDVLVDGDVNGKPEDTIRVGEGHHEFALSGKHFKPKSIAKLVTGTSTLDPLQLQFYPHPQDDQDG